MRTLLRFALALVVVGVMLGVGLRARWPRRRHGLLLALAFVPAFVHALAMGWAAHGAGVATATTATFLVAALAAVGGSWWYAERERRRRPVWCALVVPAHALLQTLLSGALERAVVARGQAFDPLATVALGGVAIVVGTALAVALPGREHAPALPRAPRWWVALMRTLGRR